MSTQTDETTVEQQEQETDETTDESEETQTQERSEEESETESDDDTYAREKAEAEDRIAEKVADNLSKKADAARKKEEGKVRKPDKRPKPQHFTERRLWGKDKG